MLKVLEVDLMEDEEKFFCKRCSQQLISVDEIALSLCNNCQLLVKQAKDNTFSCYICNKRLHSMKEIAQGMCDNCKASIIRKLEIMV